MLGGSSKLQGLPQQLLHLLLCCRVRQAAASHQPQASYIARRPNQCQQQPQLSGVRVQESLDRLHCFAAAEPKTATAVGISYNSNSDGLSELLGHLQRAAADTAEGAQLLLASSQLLSHVLQPCFMPDSYGTVPRPLQREEGFQQQVPRLGFMHLEVITGLLQGIAAHWGTGTSHTRGSMTDMDSALDAAVQAVCDLASLPMYSSYMSSRPPSFDDYPRVVLKAKTERLANTKRSNMDALDKKHIDCHRLFVSEQAQEKQVLEDLMLALTAVLPLAAKAGVHALRVMHILVSVVRKVQKRSGVESDYAVVMRLDCAVSSCRLTLWQS